MPFKYLGDWTERVAKGELPFAKPTRPQGVERNIVVTLRDWHNDKQYLHDLIASDRRYPTVNAYGPLYGSVRACLRRHADPRSGEEHRDELRVADARPDMPLALGPGNAGSVKTCGPSAYWGEENIWDTQGQQPQLDARPEGPRLARGDRARAGQSRRSARRARAIPRP